MEDSVKNAAMPTTGNSGVMVPIDPQIKAKLLRRMKTTKSNRFNCAKRLERKAQFKSSTINFLSLLTVLSGVYLLAFSNNLTPTGAQFVGVFSIGVSVVSILLSLQGAVQEISKRATDAHRCGREVSQLYRQLEGNIISPADASEEYEKVVSKYDDNHDRCDYMSTLWDYQIEMREEKEEKGATWFNGFGISLLSAFSSSIYAFIGVSLVVTICLSTPIINKYFHGFEATEQTKEDPSVSTLEDSK